jgi:DNA primase catalytic core
VQGARKKRLTAFSKGKLMARIQESEIERLKKEVSLERLVEARGVALRRHGKDLLGLCPFHDDREPSLVISPETNLWHCLGACNVGGSVVDWVMKVEGLSFRHAIEFLRDGRVAETATTSGHIVRKASVKKLERLAPREADDDALMQRVVDFYHRTLLESPEALEYLAMRGLRNEEMIGHFKLGFSNRTLGYRLPDKNRKDGAELRGKLTALGIFRVSGHEHMNGSLVVPILAPRDHGSAVLGMYGRKITPNLREGTPQHCYLPGPHRGVWNEDGMVSPEGEVILCESLIDALTFWSAGYRHVTTSYGVSGFTDEHREAFKRRGVRTVRIAYDRDDAGDAAAEKLSKELEAMGIETYRVLFPRGMDANEYALKVGPAEKSLGLALRKAEWLGNGVRQEKKVEEPSFSEPIRSVQSTTIEEVSSVEQSSASSFLAAPLSSPSPSGDVTSEHHAAVVAPPATSTSTPSMGGESGDEVCFRHGDREWRVRGLAQNRAPGSLRVNLSVRRDGGTRGFFVDTLEMYSSKQRAAYVRQAAEELELEERVVKRELGEVLLGLEQLQDARIEKELSPKEAAPTMTESERDEALALLRAPDLLERVLADFERCGIVGERENKLLSYLAVTSRKLDAPLAVVIQSSSAAGKSSLMDAALSLMPDEECVRYSAMTGQSLFYLGETDVRHKILAIAEEEGASRASYALKLLQSEGELTIASTGKDPESGKLVTHTYRVEGPVMIFLTTTAIDVDEELLNRCLVLTVDEGREQTKAIHEKQRRSQTLEGLLEKESRGEIRALHRNAQRMLRPLLVANPYAEELVFVDHATRTRRDHMKYLTLIRTVALLHQHQREAKTVVRDGKHAEYIEVTRADIDVANRLLDAVMGRSVEELPPVTKRLLGLITTMVEETSVARGLEVCDVRFTKRELREYTQWGQTQLSVHLDRLEEHEHVFAQRSGRGASVVYELAGSPLSVTTTQGTRTTSKLPGETGPKTGGSRGQVRHPHGREIEPEISSVVNGVHPPVGLNAQNAVKAVAPKIAS